MRGKITSHAGKSLKTKQRTLKLCWFSLAVFSHFSSAFSLFRLQDSQRSPFFPLYKVSKLTVEFLCSECMMNPLEDEEIQTKGNI